MEAKECMVVKAAGQNVYVVSVVIWYEEEVSKLPVLVRQNELVGL